MVFSAPEMTTVSKPKRNPASADVRDQKKTREFIGRSQRFYLTTSPMNTPYGSSVTSVPFADARGVATRPFKVEDANPLSASLKVALCGDPDMFKATSTAFPL